MENKIVYTKDLLYSLERIGEYVTKEDIIKYKEDKKRILSFLEKGDFSPRDIEYKTNCYSIDTGVDYQVKELDEYRTNNWGTLKNQLVIIKNVFGIANIPNKLIDRYDVFFQPSTGKFLKVSDNSDGGWSPKTTFIREIDFNKYYKNLFNEKVEIFNENKKIMKFNREKILKGCSEVLNLSPTSLDYIKKKLGVTYKGLLKAIHLLCCTLVTEERIKKWNKTCHRDYSYSNFNEIFKGAENCWLSLHEVSDVLECCTGMLKILGLKDNSKYLEE